MGGNESKNPKAVRATYLWGIDLSVKPSHSKPKFSGYFEVFGDAYRLGLHDGKSLEVRLHRKGESDVPKRFRCVSALLDDRCGQHHCETKEVAFGKDVSEVVVMELPETLLVSENSDAAATNSFQLGYFSLKVAAVDDSRRPDLTSASTLSSDLKTLWSGSTHCGDVEIYSNSGQCFGAHRLILSARSPVFAAMFRHASTAESTAGVVRLSDIDSSTLARSLTYMYCGQVHGLDTNTAARLLEAADKYDMPDLKESCLETLLGNLSLSNVCEAVVLAETRDLPSLGKEVRDFVAENTTAVIDSDGWTELQVRHPEMVNSVLADLIVTKQQERN